MAQTVLPCALFFSCDNDPPNKIIKQIVTSEPTNPVQEGIETYEWDVDTKYYTAKINLCASSTNILSGPVSERTNAVAITFDTSEKDCLNRVNKLWSQIKECSPQIQLLICENCKENDPVSRTEIIHWTLDNEFEFVELNEECESEDEYDVFGINRIVQALHAHTWPNLELKNESDRKLKPQFESEKEKQKEEKEQEEEDCSSKSSSNEPEYNELEENSFEDLFAQFADMKAKAEGLPSEERKKYAEEVVIKFWKSIGGDESEIANLSDDEDTQQ